MRTIERHPAMQPVGGRQPADRVGLAVVNAVVASDPRLPSRGIKRSGYGRELAAVGIREFTNIRTFWVQPADAAPPATLTE
jgi:succinate-semialdehyde dehydrogenase / glutarate-semialdehyde dehydrogenase